MGATREEKSAGVGMTLVLDPATQAHLNALELAFEDAIAAHRWSAADEMLRLAVEDLAPDSPLHPYITLFRAHLYASVGERDFTTAQMAEVILNTPALKVRAARVRATLAQQRWAWQEAERALHEAITLARQAGLPLAEAWGWRTLATHYLTLAAQLGGLPDAMTHRKVSLVEWLRMAPLLLYGIVARHWGRLPRLYPGYEYHDWLILRLLRAAERALRYADGLFAPFTESPFVRNAIVDVRLQLMDLAVQQNEPQRALRLKAEVAVPKDDPVRGALRQRVEGRRLLTQRAEARAFEVLNESYATLTRYGAWNEAGIAALLAGEAAVQQAEAEKAWVRYGWAIHAATRGRDFVAATHALARLQALRPRLEPPAQHQVDGIADALEWRGYVTRFGGWLLRLFRFVATVVVPPLAFIVAFIMAFAVVIVPLAYTVGTQSLTWSMGVGLVLGVIGAVWLQQLLYMVVGAVVVRLPAVQRRATIDPPTYFLTTPAALVQIAPDGTQTTMPWTTIRKVVMNPRGLTRRPSWLFSRLMVQPQTGDPLVIEGTTSHFMALGEDLCRHVPEVWVAYPYQWLEPRAVAVATLLAVVIGTIRVLLAGLFDPGDACLVKAINNDDCLYIAAWLISVLPWWVYTMALMGVGRLIRNRRQVQQATGGIFPQGRGIWLWVIAILVVVWMGLDVFSWFFSGSG